MIYQCLECKNQQNLEPMQDHEFMVFKCNQCMEEYYYLEGIYFIITKKDDFFNLRRKLNRYIKNKEEHP